MKFSRTIVMALTALSLGGCQATMQKMWDDVESFTLSPLDNDEKVNLDERVVEGMCPQVVIVDDLSFMSEFSDDSMRSSRLASQVFMNGAQSTCSFQKDYVELDIKVSFTGELGPKGRLHPHDKPYFSYPFFVAVTDQERHLLAKEVFSASMTFNREEDEHSYVENLRQLIPIRNRGEANDFIVMIGFQMDEAQLAYNRQHMELVRVPKPVPAPQSVGGASVPNTVVSY